jgi:outer membrane receptor protein involved in Fe transport
MKKIVKFSVVLFFVLTSVGAFAQQIISGYVFDAVAHEPVQDANVLVMPLNTGTVTDADGYFEITNLKPGKYDISISVVGFKTEVQHVNLKEGSSRSLKVYLTVDTKSLGEVSVVGESAEKRILNNVTVEPVSLKAASSVVLNSDMAKQGAVTLVDAMKYIPGALVETRGRKIKQFFSVRGQTYPYPTYAVDGVWQKEFYEMAYFINSENIQEIKIDRSSSALLKSLSPLAGVVDVVSRRFTKRETDISVRYGSFNTFDAGIVHGNTTDKLSYSTGLQFFGTNGPSDRSNARERVVNFNGDISWKINDRVTQSFKVFYVDGNRELVQPVYPAAKKLMNQKEKYSPLTTLLLSSITKFKPKESYTGELQVNYLYKNPKYFIENQKTGVTDRYRELDCEFTINQLNAWELGERNVLRAGVLLNHWKAPNGKRYYYGSPANVFTWSVVATDQQRWGKWLVDGGFRLTQEYYKEWGGFAIEGSGGKFTDVKPITNEWQSPVWQATVGVTRPVNVMLSLHGNVSAGIVAPRTDALNGDGERPENEKRVNIDLGMIKKFHNSGSLTLTGFLVNRADAIDYSGETIELDNGDIVELYKNEDKRNYGIEIDVKMPVVSWLSVFANATAMKGEVRDSLGWKKDDEMPVFIGNVGANVTKSRFDFNAYMNYTGAYKNDRFVDKSYLQQYGKAPLGDFFNVDVNTGYTLGEKKNIRIYVDVKNLLNKKYQTVAGFADYGTVISGGVKVKL